MFQWVLNMPLKASIKASVSSTFLAWAAIWLNTFFSFTLYIFISSSIRKRFSSFVVQDFYFHSNEYLPKNHHQVCKFLVVAKTKQRCQIVSKGIFIILTWRKLNMFNFFLLKWRRIKSSVFVKYAVILIWTL